MKSKIKSKRTKIYDLKIFGFTLVELLIVMSTITVITVGIVSVLNPLRLKDKAQDSQRIADVHRVKIILEEYLNDKGCYPAALTFGERLTSDGPVLPQDPLYPTESYIYVTGGSCPRWYTIFYQLRALSYRSFEVQAAEPTCDLPVTCLPANFNSGWGCLVTGNVDCPTVASHTLPIRVTKGNNRKIKTTPTVPVPTSTRTPTNTLTPTISIGYTAYNPSPTRVGVTIFPTNTLTPTIGIGYTAYNPSPTRVGTTTPSKIQTGIDGTWCYDSNINNGVGVSGICQDNSGVYNNYCQATTLKDYYCSGTWNGSAYISVHCAAGSYAGGVFCPNGIGTSAVAPTNILSPS